MKIEEVEREGLFGRKSIYKVEINGKITYLKKGLFGYSVVHPIKNDDGSTNVFNLITGGWKNLISVCIYFGIAILAWYGMNEILSQCENALEVVNNIGIGIN